MTKRNLEKRKIKIKPILDISFISDQNTLIDNWMTR